MHQIFNAVVLLASSCFSSASQTPAVAVDRAHQPVHEAIGRFSKAFVEADVSTLDALLPEDYIHTNSSGSVLNKQQWLDYIRTRKAELQSGRLEIEAYENSDLRIRVYGNSATVTGRNVARGKREGKPFITEVRFTHLWIKQDGTWKRAAFQDSAIVR